MVDLFQKLPTVLIVGVMVGIFLSLRKRVKSPRVRFWVIAWAFIFLHFFVTLFEPSSNSPDATSWWANALSAAELGTLLLSGVFFVISLSTAVEKPRVYSVLLAVLAIPMLVYSTADCFNIYSHALYVTCLAVIYLGGLGYTFFQHRKVDFFLIFLFLLVSSLAVWGMMGAWHNNDDGIAAGLNSVMCAIFTVPGILFWRRFPRWSPGVATTVAGFFAWGAVFPVGSLTDAMIPSITINPDLWNVPKYFVAFGMILVLLEQESNAAELAHEREHNLNLQLQSFADVTTRLLSGVNFETFCIELAETITRVSNFQRATIVLSDDSRRLYLAGYSGVSEKSLAHLRAVLSGDNPRFTAETIQEMAEAGRKLGRSSYLLNLQQAQKYNCDISTREYEDSPTWKHGDEILIPLLSARGHTIGCISVDDPRDPARVTPDEMSTLELLAGDLAVAVENTELHKQLVRSEKLAGIGQLVAGVAHELNNPLTSVIGYSDLIADEELNERSRQRLETLKREAQRMKRIVQNLLRFARQGQPQRSEIDFATVLNEVIALREYNLKTQGIQLTLKLQEGLPLIEADEDQVKHVLINVLSNASDAVKNSEEKTISVELTNSGNRVLLKVSDSGPGFADLDRALDPFYTTKPIGEGTGLGLSICYGIVNSHGGDLRITNLKPRGACVTVEFPVRQGVTAALAEAMAGQ